MSDVFSFQTGQLNEYTERKEMSSDVACMTLGPVPSGELRSRFLAVGLTDMTVRMISLDPADCLAPLSMQALPAVAESLRIIDMGGDDTQAFDAHSLTYLNIGLEVSHGFTIAFFPLSVVIVFTVLERRTVAYGFGSDYGRSQRHQDSLFGYEASEAVRCQNARQECGTCGHFSLALSVSLTS